MPTVHLLDYAAGNIRSLVNAIEKLGWDVEWITSPDQVAKAEVRRNCGVECLILILIADTDVRCVETYIARRRPLWSLPDSIRQCRLCRTRQSIH